MSKEDEMKELTKEFPRAFCVLVHQQEYTPSTDKTTVDYKNYRCLVGKQEPLDKVKAILEEKVKGTFEIVMQERAI